MKTYEYLGEMLTDHEIAARKGVTVKALRARIARRGEHEGLHGKPMSRAAAGRKGKAAGLGNRAWVDYGRG